ncbi:MAG: GTPase Era [Treponema sp.]|jgi:GTP-binding protein Era|nr:GTPase Era [Treponema sp.]
MRTEPKKSAFAAVLGRPSVGKSTLVNRLCGEKVAIVSPVPQTTRNTIRGIVNREAGQIVFVDTPGRHKSEKKFNRKLLSLSDRSMEDADLILYVLDTARPPAGEEEAIAEKLSPLADRLSVALNKIDAPGADPAASLAFLREKIPGLKEERIFQVSALKNQGLEELLDCLFRLAPEGEPFYPEDFYTDQDVSFRIAEIIREKTIARLREELPHSIYVDVADIEFRDSPADTGPAAPAGGRDAAPSRQRLWVRAFIAVERESQKGMVVGKGGQMIKAIRQAALKDLNRIFDWKIDLDLRVKTARDWRHNDALLKRLIDR